jgi:hypothetical protein
VFFEVSLFHLYKQNFLLEVERNETMVKRTL